MAIKTVNTPPDILAIAEKRIAEGLAVDHGYGRVSTLDQNPESQRERLTEAGCTPWIDRGQSGAKASRPQLDALMDALQPGDTFTITKLDRLGRSVGNLVDIVRELTLRGVELIVLDQNIDTRSPVGKLLFHVLAAIAEFERDLIIERTTEGQASVRLSGNMRRTLGGAPPLGFYDPGPAEDKYRDWAIDRAAADWLREAALLVLADKAHGVETAYNELTKDGRQPPADASGKPANLKMLRAALKRPASAGLLEANGAEIGESNIGGPLDLETFNRLRSIFDGRKRGRPVTAHRYPFGALLACAICGNRLTGQKGYKDRPYYGCNNPHVVDGVLIKPCHGVTVRADEVHEVLRAAVEEWAAGPEGAAVAARVPRDDSRRSELLGLIAEQQEAIGDLMDKYGRGWITKARYTDRSATAGTMITMAHAELAELDKLEAREGVPAVIDWEAMTEPEQRAAIEAAVAVPIAVRPGKGGPNAVSAAYRMEMVPA